MRASGAARFEPLRQRHQDIRRSRLPGVSSASYLFANATVPASLPLSVSLPALSKIPGIPITEILPRGPGGATNVPVVLRFSFVGPCTDHVFDLGKYLARY